MKRFRFAIRRRKKNSDGLCMHAYGLRIGYWPCLKAPFISLTFAIWRIEVWHGLRSYKEPTNG